jgi:hypothetical protein
MIELILGLSGALIFFFILWAKSIRDRERLRSRLFRAERALSIISIANKQTDELMVKQDKIRDKKNNLIGSRRYFGKLRK